MTLQPLLAASAAIQVHAAGAIGALGLGLVQFALPKGSPVHRALGWLWVGLMVLVAGSSFFIHTSRTWGPWSPIHLLSVLTLAVLPSAVWAARRHQVPRHRRAMTSLFLFALVLAGAFTLWPGRIMHAVLFGP